MVVDAHGREASPRGARRGVSLVVALALLGGAAVLGLSGLFALLYRGDSRSSGDTYVTLFGTRMNAHHVGAVVLLIAAALVGVAMSVLRRR